MAKIKEWLKKFFFPPAGASRWARVLPYLVLGALTIAVFIGGTLGWEYTNSPEFCGTACHTMPPEYSAYLVSPHARVQCVECHIGRDPFAARFTRKAGDLRHVVLNLTGAYEYPIMATRMRPAQETCETCHYPQKFSSDSLRQLSEYTPNEDNTAYDIYLVMKTGGGSAREGLGRGIHWHVENEVYFYATDDLQQEIPFIRVIDYDGNISEYTDLAADIDPGTIADEDLHRMDCITCHNRITHNVPQPDEAISTALSQGLISADLPFVLRQGVSLLTTEYEDKQTGLDAMDKLADYYELNYPEVYSEKQDEIQTAVDMLKLIYDQNVFPDQEVNWDTHPDNLGHQDFPGCFRCHDGKHFNENQEAIRLECNLCHSVPVVSEPGQLTTDIEVVTGPEPVSHTLTTWIALHGQVKDNSCQACHTLPEGIDDLSELEGRPEVDNSFCGNEACHGTAWTYAGFESAALQPILSEQLQELISAIPEPGAHGGELTYGGAIGSLLDTRCAACHGEKASSGLDVTSYETLLAGGESGPGIVPGNLDASWVVRRQTETSPHYMQFTGEELQLLEDWILAGAPE
jgi:nitrate/TMAO reductase-like tetraheme cytochrome c subunit